MSKKTTSLFKSLRGTKDILPPDSQLWKYIEKGAEELFERFGYQQVRTPIFEQTELFVRSIGDSTDIVNKEMYTFKDRKGRSITLRPDGTTPVVRTYLENQLHRNEEVRKFYYIGPFFRYERPQAGRERQFHQVGVEILGGASPLIDAEIIYLGDLFLKNLGLQSIKLLLSSVGCRKCRAQYKEKITTALSDYFSNLCADCQQRYRKNPLRILDCKKQQCEEYFAKIPSFLDNVCKNCQDFLQQVQTYLAEVRVDYKLSPHLVRGLDYYTGTTFEFISSELGAKSTLLGGGRYDNLVEELGGPSTPACGFAAGIERIIIALQQEKKAPSFEPKLKVMLLTTGSEVLKDGFSLLQKMREVGIASDMDYRGTSLKSQLRRANKLQAPYVLILGEEEQKGKFLRLKNMRTGEEEKIKQENLLKELKKKLEL